MTRYFIPDTTVLVNFTYLDRHDLLEWFVRGAGAWTLSVARESARGAQVAGLEGMAQWPEVFGAPLVPDNAELVDAHAIADRMRKPGEHSPSQHMGGEHSPSQHMGEAEAVAIIVRRQLMAVFLTDDYEAARIAAAEPSIQVASTTKILALAEAAERLDHQQARAYLAVLLNVPRVLGNPPTIAQYDQYVAELKAARR